MLLEGQDAPWIIEESKHEHQEVPDLKKALMKVKAEKETH